MLAAAPDTVTTTVLSISWWIISWSGPEKIEANVLLVTNWLKVTFERAMQNGTAGTPGAAATEPKSPTYESPNVIATISFGGVAIHKFDTGFTKVVIVLPLGMITPIRVVREGPGTVWVVNVGAPPKQLSVIAARSTPGHPVRFIGGSVGQAIVTGPVVGAGTDGCVGPQDPARDRNAKVMIATAGSNPPIFFMTMLLCSFRGMRGGPLVFHSLSKVKQKGVTVLTTATP